jgi:hypothetical protein
MGITEEHPAIIFIMVEESGVFWFQHLTTAAQNTELARIYEVSQRHIPEHVNLNLC